MRRQDLEAFRGQTVPDLIGPGLRLLFVGINPGLWTAATQTHFAHPVNRFYPALHESGLVDRLIDRSGGMTPAGRAHLVERGIGITNLVARATARADELDLAELRAGATRLGSLVAVHSPRVVAVAGITAYRAGFGRPRAAMGEQPEAISGARLWVIPNPSGLNAHETVASIAAWMSEVGRAAGLLE